MAAIVETLRDRQIEAMKGSIKKWEAIVDRTGLDHGSSDCPCCQEFLGDVDDNGTSRCKDCPIRIFTGRTWCGGTPYGDWVLEADVDDLGVHSVGSPEAHECAKAELQFLKEVLAAVEIGNICNEEQA